MSDAETSRRDSQAAIWNELRPLGKQVASNEATLVATSLRLTATESRLCALEEWQGEHDRFASSTEARLSGGLAALGSKVEEAMKAESSRWERFWSFAQPIIVTALLLLFGFKELAK